MLCGSRNGCAYTLKISRRYSGWELAVGDFLDFYANGGKNVLAVLSEADLHIIAPFMARIAAATAICGQESRPYSYTLPALRHGLPFKKTDACFRLTA